MPAPRLVKSFLLSLWRPFRGLGLSGALFIAVCFTAVIAVSFSWGAFCASNNCRAVLVLKDVYHAFIQQSPVTPTKDEIAAIRAKTKAEATQAREDLIQTNGGFKKAYLAIFNALTPDNPLRYLYGDLDFILDVNSSFCPNKRAPFFSHFSQYEQICSRIEYENTEYKTFAVLIKSGTAQKKKNLVIYNHGHGGFPIDQESFAYDMLSGLLAQDDDILVVNMPFTGVDAVDYRIKVLTWGGLAEFNPTELNSPHRIFNLFDVGHSHFMRFFIDSAVINALNLRDSYAQINFVGLSGGATTGLNVCTVLKGILHTCILSSGVMPTNMRATAKNLGDSEQIHSGFYRKTPVRMQVRSISESKTKLWLAYSSDDFCCFANPWPNKFKHYLADHGIRNVSFNIRNAYGHGYDADFVLGILRHE